jgi:hypothetical protein
MKHALGLFLLSLPFIVGIILINKELEFGCKKTLKLLLTIFALSFCAIAGVKLLQ